MKLLKFALNPPMLDLEFAVSMPKDAVIIHVGVQPTDNEIKIWAECEMSNPIVDRVFIILPTGREYDKKRKHWATVIQDVFVWHIYEVLDELA